jgi:uncharacterized membrane protein YhaH (DUF805 family)
MLTAANIIAEILSGLDAAHRAGVVHRDLKPENVMLMSEPGDGGAQLKLLDFGVARAAGTGDTGATSLGTRGYMAPEQITAPDAAQPSADLYSLSVMFYELLVGVVPQGHWQPPSGGRSDVPAAIDKLIERGLSNNPRVRPQSVAEYGKLLAEAMRTTQANTSSFAPWLQKLQDTGFKPLFDQLTPGGNRPHQPGPPGPAMAAITNRVWPWIKDGFSKNFINGKGRACRAEYWSIMAVAVVIVVIGFAYDYDSLTTAFAMGRIYVLNPYASPDNILWQIVTSGQWFPVGLGIAAVVSVAPAIAVTSRRLHDLGYTGWLTLATYIPTVGQVIAILIGVPAGKPGDNQYGPSPLGISG